MISPLNLNHMEQYSVPWTPGFIWSDPNPSDCPLIDNPLGCSPAASGDDRVTDTRGFCCYCPQNLKSRFFFFFFFFNIEKFWTTELYRYFLTISNHQTQIYPHPPRKMTGLSTISNPINFGFWIWRDQFFNIHDNTYWLLLMAWHQDIC